ncbi:MAG: hypothetical protein Q9208_000922 [Pyrenodesmia sp. 3 TL-2023]
MSDFEDSPESWISSFCSLLGHEYFAEVSEDFIEDDFNLTGLQPLVPMYKEALEMILDVEPEDEEDDEDEDEDEEEEEEEDDNDAVMRGENGERISGGFRRSGERRQMLDLSVIESSAELLYGLIHQRYITSRPGMQQMADKYDLQHFGLCPRVYCNGARVVPVGSSDIPGQDTVKLFCPSCLDIYTPPNSRFQAVDGAFFGTTFGYLFFMSFPEYDVAPKGDLINLASISPDRPLESKSRSSSLTSTPVPGSVATATELVPPPPPLPPQPSTINGIPTTNLAPGLGQGKIHENRIYGFKVAERARTGPRMKWLRDKPADINGLDESARYREQYGGDPEGEVFGGDGANGTGRFEQLSRRKKAPVRRRRKPAAEGATNGPAGDVG